MVTGLSGGPGFLLVNRQPQFHRIPTPSVCLSTVHLSPSPRSNHWSPGSSIHPPPALADTHVRLGSAGRRHHPCSYPSAVAATNRLPCSPLRLRGSPSVPATLRGGEGASLGTGTFLLSQLSRRGTASDPTPPPFFFPMFFHTQLHGDFLGLSVVWGLLPVFSRYSVRVVLHIDVFLIYFWEKVSFMCYYSAILITP